MSSERRGNLGSDQSKCSLH